MPSDRWCWTTERKLASRSASSHRAIRDVVQQLKQHGWPREDIFGVRLALEEALINAIKHGNHSDASKSVYFLCQLAADRLRLEIRDEGAGFDPELVPDPTDPEHISLPSGRGLLLMRAYMSHVEYNAKGNGVVMEKVSRARPAKATGGDAPAGD